MEFEHAFARITEIIAYVEEIHGDSILVKELWILYSDIELAQQRGESYEDAYNDFQARAAEFAGDYVGRYDD